MQSDITSSALGPLPVPVVPEGVAASPEATSPTLPVSEAESKPVAPQPSAPQPAASQPMQAGSLETAAPATAAPGVAPAPAPPQNTPGGPAVPTVIVDRQRTQAPVAPSAPSMIGRRWQWWQIAGATTGVLLVMVAGGAYGAYATWRSSDHIAANLFIQGEAVGGLTAAEARQRLHQRFDGLTLKIQTPDHDYQVPLNDLGGHLEYDRAVQNAYWFGRSGNAFQSVWRLWKSSREDLRLKLTVKWNKEQLRRRMYVVARQYERPARDARLHFVDGGLEVVPEQEGSAINVGATLQNLQRDYYPAKPSIVAVIKPLEPRVAAANLAGQDVKLDQYTTYFDSGVRGRTRNIHLAAAAINGSVLMPGDLFSFNKRTGERTSDKGYRIGHIFVHKRGEEKAEVVEGLGGGVCQVSSTLYNAVRKSNKKAGKQLKIVERNEHSLPVTYVPSGLDATVAWPDKDFKFRNKFSFPVYLRAEVSGAHLTISVWGRIPNGMSSPVPVQLTAMNAPSP